MRYFLLILSFMLVVGEGYSAEKKTVCLNMIIKDESPVIKRCLESVKSVIDTWIIVDTGSTDGTQKIVKEFMKDIPGELHERAWVNFGHNRNEALELAKGKADYILIIDADESLVLAPDFKFPELDKDFYYITTEFGGTTYPRNQLFKDSIGFKWIGDLHEVPCCDNARTSETLKGIVNYVRTDGNRSTDPLKYHKDAAILEKAMARDPNNTRNQFYLAQSYRDAGQNELALKHYKKRVAMGGWDEEVFWSMLQIGILQENLKMDPEVIKKGYSIAYQYRPSRIEPLYRLAIYSRSIGDFKGAYEAALKGLNSKVPADLLFVENWIYDYGLLFEYSIAAYWVEKFQESSLASQLLLKNVNLPQNVRECIDRNLNFAHLKIKETQEKAEILKLAEEIYAENSK